MATRRVEIGPTGDAVRANVARVRTQQRITLRQLADRLTDRGHPLSYTTLSQIENGARRVDVDDLVALANALGVSPIALLAPPEIGDLLHAEVRLSGVSEACSPRRIWDWLRADAPLETDDDSDDGLDAFRQRNFPDWAYAEDRKRRYQLQATTDAELSDDFKALIQSTMRTSIVSAIREAVASREIDRDGDD